MTDFAKHIEITRHGRQTSLRIDGKEVPWYTGDTIEVRHRVGEMASVTVSIPTERVTSDDNLSASGNSADAPGETDPTGRLARAEAARDQAEELLGNAHEALEDNHATIDQLHAELAAARSSKMQLAEALGKAQAEPDGIRPGDLWLSVMGGEPPCCWGGGCSSGCPKAPAPPTDQGLTVGVAHVEIRPDFSAFEGQEFQGAVDRAVRRALRNL